MNRRSIIQLHLLAAAFFAPLVVITAISGGLYLVGIKGTSVKTPIAAAGAIPLNPASPTLESDVRALIGGLGLEHEFEYVKVSGDRIITRPTSRPYLEITTSGGDMSVQRVEPSLQMRLVELHKGHGPLLYKDFQKLMAAGIVLILLSGLWLGLGAPALRARTLLATVAGLLAVLGLALLA
ncbi:MAG: PepSY-associated TM helix domain-containing protein [Gammaproteobacteria bacterium]